VVDGAGVTARGAVVVTGIEIHTVEPKLVVVVPTGQVVWVTALEPETNDPTLARTQLLDATLGWYVPGPHSCCEVAPD